jgi:hypothetical protein
MDNFGNVWLANLVSAGVILAVLGFFLKRYVSSTDARIKAVEEEGGKIKSNYLSRFEKLDYKMETVRADLSDKIQEVNAEKMQYRLQQTETLAIIKTKVEQLTDQLPRGPRQS